MGSQKSDCMGSLYIFFVVTFLFILNMTLLFEALSSNALYISPGLSFILIICLLPIKLLWAVKVEARTYLSYIGCFFVCLFSFVCLRDFHFWNASFKESTLMSEVEVILAFLYEYLYCVTFISFLKSINSGKNLYFNFYNLFCVFMLSAFMICARHSSLDSIFTRLVFSCAVYQFFDHLISHLNRKQTLSKKVNEVRKVGVL